MINCMLLTQGEDTQYGGDELIEQWENNETAILWLDINNHDSNEERLLLTRLHCHTLAI